MEKRKTTSVTQEAVKSDKMNGAPRLRMVLKNPITIDNNWTRLQFEMNERSFNNFPLTEDGITRKLDYDDQEHKVTFNHDVDKNYRLSVDHAWENGIGPVDIHIRFVVPNVVEFPFPDGQRYIDLCSLDRRDKHSFRFIQDIYKDTTVDVLKQHGLAIEIRTEQNVFLTIQKPKLTEFTVFFYG